MNNRTEYSKMRQTGSEEILFLCVAVIAIEFSVSVDNPAPTRETLKVKYMFTHNNPLLSKQDDYIANKV